MARESLLKESWRETRDTTQRFLDRSPWFTFVAAAVVLVILGFIISQSRSGNDAPPTVLRADQQSLSTSTTAFGFVAPTFPALTPIIPSVTPTSLDSNQTIPGFGAISPRPTSRTATTTGSTATTSASTGTTTGGSATTTTTAVVSIAPSAFNANRIAFVASGGMWTINADGTDMQPVAPNAFTPAWSPSHSKIAVSDADKPGGGLSVISSSGTRTQLTSGSHDTAPTWSPDGARLAFARDASGIWVVNQNGTNQHRIASSNCINSEPTWSPDGVHIAFWSSRDHCTGDAHFGNYELYVMDSDGSNVRRLGTAPNSGAPSFSPDGSTIAFATDQDGNAEIHTIKIDGTGEQRLTTTSEDETDPTWSPDGTRIAFFSERGGGRIYTMKTDGTDRAFVADGAQPSWS